MSSILTTINLLLHLITINIFVVLPQSFSCLYELHPIHVDGKKIGALPRKY